MYHPIKESDMRTLSAYQLMLRKSPKLKYLFFELTDRCNLNCLHCGSRCTVYNDTFLNIEVIEETLNSVAEKYNPSEIMICLTGGEPLLHSGIFKVIETAHSLGFPVGITSNGTLIDNGKAYRLAAAGLDTIAISIDGIGSVHDNLRMKNGSFNKAIKGINALKKYCIEPQVLTVVHKNNIFRLNEMFEFFTELDIYSWRLVNIDPIGRAAVNKELLLNAADLKYLFNFIRTKRFDVDNKMEVTYGCSHFAAFEYEREIRDFYFQCGAGTIVASVRANGNIGACLDIERREDLVQGNVYKDNFVGVWENKFEIFRTDRTENSNSCSECNYRNVCMGDSAHTWDFDNHEPLYCVAKKIMEV